MDKMHQQHGKTLSLKSFLCVFIVFIELIKKLGLKVQIEMTTQGDRTPRSHKRAPPTSPHRGLTLNV